MVTNQLFIFIAGQEEGAFEAGAIMGLIDLMPPGDFHWDVISGKVDFLIS
jgi:hypothetical protein